MIINDYIVSKTVTIIINYLPTGLVLHLVKKNNSVLLAMGLEPKEFNEEKLMDRVERAFGRNATEVRNRWIHRLLPPITADSSEIGMSLKDCVLRFLDNSEHEE